MIEKSEIVDLIAGLIPMIGDDYRADPEDTEPSMSVTAGTDDALDSWGYQTGDNSFTGGAYSFPHWAIVTLRRDSNPLEVADEIFSQWAELIHS